MRFQLRDVAYYNDNRVTVMEGPFRTLDHPGIDQYIVKHGTTSSSAWESDLISEEEYEAMRSEEIL